ncbi:type IV pilus modification protein PilV [Kangiella marina]|uniref:Type IV pilin Tt1218-like domain-containing protein n=1 Tax=Kangiella marina TaxID=1079178 RepID=A0ABP8IP50_9GAMM
MGKSKNSGFTLMEVLIAMVVIAIGLLGYLSLQLASINSNQEGMARSQANLIAQDLAASIRANRAYINQGDGTANVGNVYVDGDYNSCSALPATVCTGAAANCTDEEQAQFDVYKVCQSKAGFNTATADSDLLIDGQLFVTCDDRAADGDSCSPGSTLSIFTYWQTGALRDDVGQDATVIRNQRCANLADDPGVNYDCIILDIMP